MPVLARALTSNPDRPCGAIQGSLRKNPVAALPADTASAATTFAGPSTALSTSVAVDGRERPREPMGYRVTGSREPEAPELWNGYTLAQRLDAGGETSFHLATREGADACMVVLVGERSRFAPWADPAVAQRLDHPNVVRLLASHVFESRRGVVLELVSGLDLREVLLDGPIGRAAACLVAHDVAAGLTHALDAVAHDGTPLPIRHGWLCPRAIRVTAAGEVKVGGFLLHRFKPEGLVALDRVDEQVLYLAPEQTDGSVTNDVPPATDVFALAAVLHELLTGEPPVKAATIGQLCRAHLLAGSTLSRAGSAASEPVVSLLERALSPAPGGRQRDARAIRDELGACPELKDAGAARTELAERVQRAVAIRSK